MWIITMDSDGFCGFPWIVVVYSGWQPKNIGSFPMKSDCGHSNESLLAD
jgi:hypothetical protein